MKNSIKVKEILRFTIGGGTGVLVDYSVYWLLLLANFETSLSKAISFICGAFIGFVINKLWTFESKKFLKIEVFRYVCLYSVTAVINIGVNEFVLEKYSIKILAFLCATGISTILNFLGQKYFVFNGKGQ